MGTHIHNDFIEKYISASLLSNALLVFLTRRFPTVFRPKTKDWVGKVCPNAVNTELNVLKDRGESKRMCGSDTRENEQEFPSPVDLSTGHDEALTEDSRIRWYLHPWESQEHLWAAVRPWSWHHAGKKPTQISQGNPTFPLHLSMRLVVLKGIGEEKGTAGRIDGIQDQDLVF